MSTHTIKLKQKISKLQIKTQKLEQNLEQTLNIRLALGLLIFICSILIAMNFAITVNIALLIVLILTFIYFFRISLTLRRFLKNLKTTELFYARQISKINRENFEQETTTPVTSLSQKYKVLVHDLDILGEKSLFHLINETWSQEGAIKLTDFILKPSFQFTFIQDTQALIKKLAQFRGYLLGVKVVGHELEENLADTKFEILKELPSPLFKNNFYYHLISLIFIWFAFLLSFILNSLQVVEFPVWSIWLIFFVYNLFCIQKVQHAYSFSLSLSRALKGLNRLFKKIERTEHHDSFRKIFPSTHSYKPSRALIGIERVLSFLSVQSHPLVFLIVNLIAPWTCLSVYFLEKYRRQLSEKLPQCIEEMKNLEVWVSLALLYHYQTQTFPEITENDLEFKNLVHPLIATKQSVANDFKLEPPISLALITGSNMAGKSTFLRAVGLNHLLAMIGAPVFADEFKTPLARLVSCIRISDSVRDGFSYFYAETVQLKKLLDKAQTIKTIFLIDEVFKGTNNRERLIGSKALLTELSQTNSLGFVTSHDLDLTTLTKINARIGNYHFRDEVEEGKMSFPYKIFPGPCPTTNALRIMEKVGLPIKADTLDSV